MTRLQISNLLRGGTQYSTVSSAVRAASRVRRYCWADGAQSALYEPRHWQWVSGGEARTVHLWIERNEYDDVMLRMS